MKRSPGRPSKRQVALSIIRSEVAETGKVTARCIDASIEGRVKMYGEDWYTATAQGMRLFLARAAQ